MVGAFHSDAGRIIHMQVDPEGGRKLRWPAQTDRPLVPGLVDDPSIGIPKLANQDFKYWGERPDEV